MIQTTEDLETLIEVMQGRGESLNLHWSEKLGQWQVVYMANGYLYKGKSSCLQTALRDARRSASLRGMPEGAK